MKLSIEYYRDFEKDFYVYRLKVPSYYLIATRWPKLAIWYWLNKLLLKELLLKGR